jgi:carboxypeptidase PM20D1
MSSTLLWFSCINVELSVSGPGGHSSMPPVKKEEKSIVSILGDAIKKLEANPLPPHFEKDSGLRLTLQYLASEKTVLPPSFPFNLIFSNLWLFRTLIKQFMLKSSNAGAAMLRTTTAVCMIKGGTKLNILPYVVQAYVNHRVHPMDTIESVLEYDR